VLTLPRLLAVRILVSAAALAVSTPAARAQLTVITSGGFEAAYRQLLPEFERTSGIRVATRSGSSQGTGPETIRAQLARGMRADVVILSKNGLDDLIAAGRIVSRTDVDVARTPLGAAMRAGASKPDLGTVEALKRALLNAKAVAVPGSTSGIYVTATLLPRLGIAGSVNVKVTARGTESAAMVASGGADMAIQPVSELVHAQGASSSSARSRPRSSSSRCSRPPLLQARTSSPGPGG
jgi:molybdate transport system substrate-binding protein